MSVVFQEQLAKQLVKASRVVALTGAGISAESGIPTFRGQDGLWKKFSPSELASFEAFYRNTAIVSEWYKYRRDIINSKQPNAAHFALAQLRDVPKEFILITQNVDGLHQRAGSDGVIELHGNITKNYCINCGKRYTAEEFDEIYNSSSDHIPRCWCEGLIRPDVVWFGESLPEGAFEKAYQMSIHADIFLSIGTSAEVRPAADLPRHAKSYGAFLIEINPNRTSLTDIADLWLQGPAGEILPEFVENYKNLLRNSLPSA